MRNLLIAAAAFAAIAIPTTPAEAERGGHHWRSGGGAMHWQGHRGFSRPAWRGHWRGHPGSGRHGWRGQWRGHPGFGRRAWRGHWRGHPGWHHSPGFVVVGGGFAAGPGFGWGHPYAQPCRTLWFDGWAWRCGW